LDQAGLPGFSVLHRLTLIVPLRAVESTTSHLQTHSLSRG